MAVKVVVVAETVEPYAGAERNLFEAAEGLAGRGHELHLLYRETGTLLPGYQSFCRSTRQVRGTFVADPERAKQTSAGLLRALLEGVGRRADVLYVNESFHTAYGVLVSKQRRAKLVCHLQLPAPSDIDVQLKFGLPRVHRYVAVSDYIRRDYVGIGIDEERIDVVHTGLDLGRWRLPGNRTEQRRRLGLGDDAFVVLYAGRLDPEKNVEVLIDAWRRLGLGPDEGRLLVLGEPRSQFDRAKAAAYVASLHERAGDAAVSFLGRVADVRPYYEAADVSVLPCTWAEPQARAVLESMACERPIVATDVGGTPEMLTGRFSSLLVPPGDVDALAQRLGALRDWQTRQPDLGAACRRHVAEHFTIDATIDGIERSFRRALGR